MSDNRYQQVINKNVLVPIVSFRIEQVAQIKIATKIQGTLKTPPDFDAVNDWITIDRAPNGKFSTKPDKLVTDLIVVLDSSGNKLGYLNKLFDFSFVINLEFELFESVDIVDKEVAVDLWLIYQVHAESDLSVHPNFLSKVATVGKLYVIQKKYEQYIKEFALNPILKEDPADHGEYLFQDFDRTKQGVLGAIKAVSFPSVSGLSQGTGMSFSGMRIGFNFLEGYFLFKVFGSYVIVITPRSRQRTSCNCYILQADRTLDSSSRVFCFAGNFYLVSDGNLIVLRGMPKTPKEISGYSVYDYTGTTETRSLLSDAVAFEFSHLGDLVINRSTKSLYSVLFEQDTNFSSFMFNEYYKKYFHGTDSIERIKSMYKCAFDNWEVNQGLSSAVLLSNRWCLFKHKASNKILATSNYPIINNMNRRVINFPQVNFPSLDNDYMILKDKSQYIDLKNNLIQNFSYIDMYLGNRLTIVGGQFVIC